ncbi:putative pentatricopeptide repeat-containing protein At5g09950 [Magnolia sinica]|uniref:putative pentatricopeptide repeat-containing protein At5g09950 n=1 Tax=Magnolia sinica TaxID=86752 RepID=UPI00265AB6DE|nr:putative pentatricopeptide repeat-containing protein At5g09950 [Magnolia sinica]
MKRLFAPSDFKFQLSHFTLRFSTISSPPPTPPQNPPLPQLYRENLHTHFDISPTFKSIPLEKPINFYKRSHPHFESPPPSAIPVQKPLNDRSDCSPSISKTYDDLVRRFVGSRDPNDADRLHLQIVKNGFVENLFLSNTLINVYSKIGDLLSAHQLFDEMSERNAVSWTCLISGYAQHGLPDEACDLFCLMLRAGVSPTQFSFGSVLRACQGSGPTCLKFGLQIHGAISKTRFALDVVVCNALISMYGSCCIGSTEFARQVFQGMSIRNSISWNSIISVYSQKGDVFSAFGLYLKMQREGLVYGLKPNEYTFGSLITATYSCCPFTGVSGSFLLEQMLSQVMKSGFLSDLYVGSALVSAFARFGLLDIAKGILGQMSERNAVSANGLMVGLVKQKCGEEALEIFRETRNLIGMTCDSYVILLSACAEFLVPEEGKRKGREVHGFLIRTGMNDEKVAIGNGLVNMYAKCGAVADSCTVFNHIRVKDLVSWNSMIAGLDQNGRFKEALATFHGFQRSGLMPSNFALISTLSSCASLGCIRLGTQVHCEGIKLGLDSDISVLNSLIAFYAESGYITDCWKVFISMREYDQISWNSMIGALADSEASIYEVVEIFLDMMRAGWSPNRVTFINILAAVSSLSFLELARQLHALVLKYCLAEDNAVENALVSCYASTGEMDDCERLFIKMSERRDEVSWNTMIAGYIHNGLLPKAMDFLWLMMQNGQRMDHFTFATVLSACASVAALGRGMEIHAHGIRACLESDVVVESSLVDMYSKCGRVDYASRVFGLMSVRNEFSWNSMISGYARHGHGKKALELFTEMQCEDLQPDHVTFVGVLSACSHVGLVDRGLEYFESMSKTYGLIPRMEHYSCMVDLLARAGELDKVEEFIRRMPMKPNALVWRTVLSACCRSNGGKMDLGKLAGEMLLQLEPQNPVNYVLVSNMYASGGRWEDVAKARAAMREVSVKKEAGCSWVTMKDGVHIFVAGDKSHPDTDEIYAKLRILNQKMRDAGYVPQTKFALYDLEVENKEELLSVHSEKLAVAFVLIRMSGLPIRIMKNLRVCGDCHSAFRYISKITSRQIILRDSNRFHHFSDGKCSCGDYW